MIAATAYADKRVVLLGLGISGLATARSLAAGGARLTVWDDGIDARKTARGEFEVFDPALIDWHQVDALVIAPGIPFTHPAPHPAVAAAQAAGRPVIGDVELFAKARPAGRTVGITGTNGKSTTTALVGHILHAAACRASVGGNIGLPALELAPVGPDGVFVLELSSYQIDIAPSLDVDVSVLLNITPDHLDRHGSMDGYIAVKRKLLEQQTASNVAIVGIDTDPCARIAKDLFLAGRRVIPVSTERELEDGVYVKDAILYDAIHGTPRRAMDLTVCTRLPGVHNWQNAAAAYAAARAVGVAPTVAAEALPSFPGLAHRQELIAAIDGIRFVNDSKATNAVATATALASYERVVWIAGGRAKQDGLAATRPHWDRIAHAVLMGEAAPTFAAELQERVPVTQTADMAEAVAAAAAIARRLSAQNPRPKPVVLLSPACASFDQFENFAARGEAFRAAVSEVLTIAVAGAGDAVGAA